MIDRTLAVDLDDTLVSGYRTIELSKMCKRALVMEHHEGHCIPMRGDWPKVMRDFILSASMSRMNLSHAR